MTQGLALESGEFIPAEELNKMMIDKSKRAHVQNPAEIEHVAGDVSKNGAESNMAQQPTKAESLRQILTDPENQPNQYGVQFLMHGAKMAFRIGNRQFCLDYEPDEPGEFEFMRDALIDAFSVFTPDVKMAQQPAPSAAAATEVENLRKAIQFYADKDHFTIADDGAWDTVSGEPQNYWCDEEGTATVEDGTIARLALAGHQIKFDADAAPQPSPTPQAVSQPAPDERDDFEKVFPLPSGCIRVGTGYASTGYSNWAAHTHCERWQGWQARAARAPADSVLEDAARMLESQHTWLTNVAAANLVRSLAARKQGANHD